MGFGAGRMHENCFKSNLCVSFHQMYLGHLGYLSCILGMYRFKSIGCRVFLETHVLVSHCCAEIVFFLWTVALCQHTFVPVVLKSAIHPKS